MNIIVADDEFFARYSLVSMLKEWLKENVEILEAENGEEVIHLVERQIPDLVFLDIRMPKMDGLEAFAALREKTPDTQWVIVSGYADFAYARKALLLGAKDYLMKPVNVEELGKLLEKLIAEQKAVRNQKVKLFSTDMGLSLQQMETEDKWKEYAFCGTVLCQSYSESEEDAGKRNKSYRDFLKGICADFLAGAFLHGPVVLSDGSLALISAKETDKENLEDIHEGILRRLDEEFSEKGRPVLFTTGLCGGVEELAERLSGLSDFYPYAVLCEEGKLLSLETLEKIKKKQGALLDFCSAVQMAGCEFREDDYGKYLGYVDEAEKIIRESEIFFSYAMKRKLVYFWEVLFQEETLSEEMWWDPEFLRRMGEKRLLKKKKPGKHTVEKVKEYLLENYERDISVGNLAELFSITPNYLSALFKNEMNQSLVQYLTDIRIRKAKELLTEPDRKITSIAEMVGFRNTGYFARVFKSNTGMEPSEFRKKLRQ